MSKNSRNRYLIAGLLALLTANTAHAQDVGTRASGMAGAFVAVADDATAVYWNPAGVATGSIVSVVLDAGRFKLGLSNPQGLEPQEDTSAILALSATAIGLAYYRLGTYGKGAAEPAVTGPQSREEVRRRVHALTTNTVGVSLVQSLSEHIVVGATPKVMRGAGRFAADVDVGVMAWANRFRFGLVARNLTTPTFAKGGPGESADEIELQREVRIGGAWGSGWTGISRVIVSLDGDVIARSAPGGDRKDVAAGVETWWKGRRLGLRSGVRRSTIGDARAALAAGVSAGLKPGMLLEAHVVRGHGDERSWSVGARLSY
ncbi:MAG: conjugal transfer protein TraF [Cyanobacteria bacterium]|nr:conjugal transfer protein TraF [Cyanobacteriota bacterium]